MTVRMSDGRRWVFCRPWTPEGQVVVSIRNIKCPKICWESMVGSNSMKSLKTIRDVSNGGGNYKERKWFGLVLSNREELVKNLKRERDR